MISILVNRKTPVEIGAITLDASVSQSHEYVNEITSYPVEEGFDITDNVRQLPETLTIEGLVSNSPIPNIGSINTSVTQEDNSNRSIVAFQKFLEYMGFPTALQPGQEQTTTSNDAQLIDIVTKLKTYTNMILKRLTIPRTRTTGNDLFFTAEFQQVHKAISETILIQNVSSLDGRAPGIEDQGPSKRDTGVQSTTQPSSFAFGLLTGAL